MWGELQRERRTAHASALRAHLTVGQTGVYIYTWAGRRTPAFAKQCAAVVWNLMRRAYRIAVEHNMHPTTRSGAARRLQTGQWVMWNRLKGNIPEDWIQGRPSNTECVMQMRTGPRHDPDALRGSGLWSFLGDEWDDAKPVIPPEIHDGIATLCAFENFR